MLLFINSFECSFFQSSNVKGLLSDTIEKGKKSREGGKEGGRKGRREEGKEGGKKKGRQGLYEYNKEQ